MVSDSLFYQESKTNRLSVREDSVEIRSNISWTSSLRSIFKNKYGYDVRMYLPSSCLRTTMSISKAPHLELSNVFWTPDRGIGYLNDFRRALTEGYRQYLQALRKWVNTHLHLQTSYQGSYDLPMDMEFNVPEVNAPECESLQFQNNVDGYRQFVGPADLAGKRVITNELGGQF